MNKSSVPGRILFAIALISSGVIVGGVVSSYAASNSSLISACVDRKSGTMRYLQKGRCKKTELGVSWNVQGPTGIKGPDGIQGLQGPRGVSGETGPSGAQGSIGPAGADGATGETGPSGAQGSIGPAGDTASTSGNTVRSGAGVPSNSIGADGDFYIDTSASKIHGPKANSVWPIGVSLVGAAGLTGAIGSTGLQGVAGQGVLSSIPATSVSKANTDADAISLASYTSIASVGAEVEISVACGYETVSTPSIVAWSVAVKAPIGSKILGQTTYRNDATPDYLYGVADGTRKRLRQENRDMELTNGDFLTVSIFGPTISPVVIQLSIDLTSSSCNASGILQTL